MQVASSLRGDRIRSSSAAAPSMRASRPLRVSRLVVVGMLAGLEGITVPVMGIASHEMLASHQLPSEAWAMGTGVISLGGRMVDAPVVKRAARVIRTANALGLADIVLEEEVIHGAE